MSHLLTFTVAYLRQKHPDSSQLYDDTMHVYFTRDVCTVYILCTMYILHLHTSYLLTLVAVVEHMVGFRTIACLSLGLVIFLMFFSPLTHIVSIIIVVTYYFLFVSLYIHTRKYGRLCRPIFSPFGYGRVRVTSLEQLSLAEFSGE